jgi:hypothetical protein
MYSDMNISVYGLHPYYIVYTSVIHVCTLKNTLYRCCNCRCNCRCCNCQLVQDLVSEVLQGYCVRRGAGYKQGLNELLAPLVALRDPPLPAAPIGLMFESLVETFGESRVVQVLHYTYSKQ